MDTWSVFFDVLTLIRLRVWAKKAPPPTSFSLASSTNVGVRPQNFLTFSLNSFATLVRNFKTVPSASPKLLNFNQDHSPKKGVFLVKSLKNWDYDNFSYRNAKSYQALVKRPHLQYNLSLVINFLWTSWTKIVTS